MLKENLIGLMRDCLLKPHTNINDVSNPAYINLPACVIHNVIETRRVNSMTLSLDVEHAVNDRYSLAAHQREAQLCCPIEYDSKFLDVIPK